VAIRIKIPKSGGNGRNGKGWRGLPRDPVIRAALIVFLVVAGSLWIMSNLNDNMMPGAELMNLHMQH